LNIFSSCEFISDRLEEFSILLFEVNIFETLTIEAEDEIVDEVDIGEREDEAYSSLQSIDSNLLFFLFGSVLIDKSRASV
jgi:hypothetical protein